MLKVYGVHGRTQALIKVPFNNNSAWLPCEFRHGRVGAGMANKPATYATADEIEQKIIENSDMFGKLIVLVRATGAEEKKVAAKGEEQPAPLKAITGVTSREEAVAYLKAEGAKATNLKDDESIQKYAAKIGVCFPNLYD